MDDFLRRREVRVGLVVISVVAAVSVGGGFIAGIVLAPALVLAGRHVPPRAATGYGALSAVLAAEVGWALAYVLVGEQRPSVWLVPTALGSLTVTASVWAYRRRPVVQPRSAVSAPA